ncbi:MAG: DNA mismatch repair endonuclease MutL [Candidatus Poribacteria bacterium]|nr:DNA mismatch repair endonuclease MutL [Candidatus Poribacteria bacterium]
MAKIKILPPDVSNKIAAGEVVERPASAVKELIENAVDAKSTSVGVEVRAGGKRLLRVSDNGTGMSRKDALVALERHATSKVRCIEDLQRIQTFGFRGEALPSIASVSQFELLTRTAEALEGTKVTVDGGVVRSVQESGCSPGTHITVNNLFYNVPARQKFLKSGTTEFNHITNQVMWAALAHPKVQFSLSHNGRTSIDVRSCDSHIERIRLLYGKEFAENLIEFDADLAKLHLHCFIGKPELTKSNRNYQLFFLNRRPIRSKILGAALAEAMRSMVPKDRYAVALLFLTMDTEEVDVNVHPAKIEVRFRNEQGMYGGVVRVIHSGVYKHKYIPRIETDGQDMAAGEKREISDGARGITDSSQVSVAGRKNTIDFSPSHDSAERAKGMGTGVFTPPTETLPTIPRTDSVENEKSETTDDGLEARHQPIPSAVQPPHREIPEAVTLELFDFEKVELKTNLFNTYIVAEGQDKVFIIDQHVAAERVLYERFVEQLKADGIPVQGLLLPVTMEMNSQQLNTFNAHESLFKTLGFDVEPFGGNTIVVRSIPAPLPMRLVVNTVTDLLDRISTIGQSSLEMLEIQDQALVTLACKSAVKAGDPLTMEEMVNLIKELSQAKLPFNCPHSRPITIEMSKNELERRFHRR